MAVILLVAICLVSLFIIPLGLPGTWVMLAAGVGYSILVPNSIGWITLVGVTVPKVEVGSRKSKGGSKTR